VYLRLEALRSKGEMVKILEEESIENSVPGNKTFLVKGGVMGDGTAFSFSPKGPGGL